MELLWLKWLNLVYCNSKLPQLYGYDQNEYKSLFAENLCMAIHPDDREVVQRKLKSVIDQEQMSLTITYRHCCKDGQWRWTSFSGQMILGEDGKKYVSGIVMEGREQNQED